MDPKVEYLREVLGEDYYRVVSLEKKVEVARYGAILNSEGIRFVELWGKNKGHDFYVPGEYAQEALHAIGRIWR